MPITLEMLTSFSLGGITPYAKDDAPDRLTVHRYRSNWSAEGRLDSQAIEDLHLERSWIGHGIACERFGQVGSMPVRGFFPFVALEDREAGVFWGAQLACPGSWQMEIFRKDDFVAFSGGPADREFGHWFKTLQPGDGYETPVATIGCIRGNLDQLAQRLTSAQESPLASLPKIENDLPIVVNEWCTSWGNPTAENLLALAKRLQGTPARYLVIDDGWAERLAGADIQSNGDWLVNQSAFPGGLAATCQAIRNHGLIPGIWFEFEVCNPGSKAFALTDHHLHRDGRVLVVGDRRFWDFRDPFTSEYLTTKVTNLLRDNGIGYLKVDYNDTIGIGVDGAESPGEGLRQHLAGVQEFFRRLRTALPDLVIENCSSGGHRLEPSMMALCAMGSFSDAHETLGIPIIAANLQRLILPRQSQIWAVLRKDDTVQRLSYSLAATFLGRMCLSGEIHDLSPAQWRLVVSAMKLYLDIPIVWNISSRSLAILISTHQRKSAWLVESLHLFSTQTKRIMNTTSDRGRWPRPNHLAPAALAVAAILMTGPLVAQSAGDNLLKNGDAEAGTAETFTAKAANVSLAAEGEAYEGKHAFQITVSDAAAERDVIGSDLIPVNPQAAYTLSAVLRSAGSEESSEVHVGLLCLTEDETPIHSQHINRFEGTETELSADACEGDTVLRVKKADQWKVSPNAFVAFDVDDSGAFSDLPNSNLSPLGIVAVTPKGDHGEVELARPLRKFYAAGTKIRQHGGGNSYVYCAAAYKNIPSDWTPYSGKVGGVSTGLTNSMFWPGTHYVKVVILPGRGPDQRLLVDNIEFREE